jgi:hypothetical protein
MVEHAAVNRGVVGSSPTSGASLQVAEVQRRLVQKGRKNPEMSGKVPGKLGGKRCSALLRRSFGQLCHCSLPG